MTECARTVSFDAREHWHARWSTGTRVGTPPSAGSRIAFYEKRGTRQRRHAHRAARTRRASLCVAATTTATKPEAAFALQAGA
eukprot:5178839-Pleurochrysis_carterae.AAC.1